MIGIGYWKNSRWVNVHERYVLVDPQRLPTSTYRNRKSRIVEFLRGGELTVACQGYSHCRFEGCPTPDPEMGSGNLTDGVFDWPEGLVHYVEAHDVELPEAFIDYVLDGADAPEADLWTRWSAQRREFDSDPNPASADEVHALADEIATPKYAPRFERHDDHWALFQDGLMIDAVPLRSREALEVYLYAKRWGVDTMSAAEARRILASSHGPRLWRMITLGPRVVVDRGQPYLYHRGRGVGMQGMDELELRYRVRVAAEDSVWAPEAIAERYRRHWA